MKAVEKLKFFSEGYKYVILMVVAAIVFAMFSTLGTQGTNAVETEPVLPNNPPTQAVETNIPERDSDLQLLEETIAQGTAETDPVENSAQREGQVLQATTTNSGESVADVQTHAFIQSITNGATKLIEGDLVAGTIPTADGGNVTYYSYTGAIPGMISIIGTMYEQKPVSVEVWAQDIQNRANLSVNAQTRDANDSDTYNPGQGYELLQPIQSLWRAAVNLVYVIYILIVVLLAFLILFRSQLGGQETITLYNAIPSLIISLILVYFSYPISALAIDTVTIGSGIVYGALVGQDISSDAPGSFLYGVDFSESARANDQGGITDQAIGLVTGQRTTIDPRYQLQVDDRQVNVWQIFSTSGISPTGEDINVIIPQDVPLANAIKNIIGGAAGSGITDSLLKLVFVFAAFSASLKLFFTLLKSYIFMVTMPLLSPFIFLLAAIPTQTNSIIFQYFGRLIASALSFVAVYTVFLVIIIIARDTTNPGDLLWTPPLLGYSAEQTIPGTQVSSIARPLIAYALFISTPLIPDYIFEIFQASGDSPFISNVAESTKGGARTVMGGITSGSNFIRSNLMGIPSDGGGGGGGRGRR